MSEPDPRLIQLVQLALQEDIGSGDLTSLACLDRRRVRARIRAKSSGVLSGTVPTKLSFELLDPATRVQSIVADGRSFKAGDVVFHIEGNDQPILTAERTALNFLAHLSGIATVTRRFVDAIQQSGPSHSCRMLDTRKTTPGLRMLEKAAVKHGGGCNHRIGLYDMVLIKDNHIAAAGSITSAVEKVRDYLAHSKFDTSDTDAAKPIEIEVEVTNEDELREAVDLGIERLLLDNQSLESLTRLVETARELRGDLKLEASGNVSLENVAAVALTGVDFISAGALTHSAPASDFSLELLR